MKRAVRSRIRSRSPRRRVMLRAGEASKLPVEPRTHTTPRPICEAFADRAALVTAQQFDERASGCVAE